MEGRKPIIEPESENYHMPGHPPFGPDRPEFFDWVHALFFGFLPVLFGLAGLLLLAWILSRWLSPSFRPRMAGMFGQRPIEPPAFERLRQRYAAGEIDATTFEQMWERLQASYHPGGYPPPPPPPRGPGRPPDWMD